MNLYLISQDENNDYDTYDSAVVAAESEDEARGIHPDEFIPYGWTKGGWTWCSSPDKVTVKYIGTASESIERGIVLASFNAG